MIGQHKRLLEHISSSQPVKYQKQQSDDKSSDAHTRVASLTDEKHEFEQHFSGVSQKKAFSVSPGASCDAMKVFERVLVSESQDAAKKEKPEPEPEPEPEPKPEPEPEPEPGIGACCGSHGDSALSEEPDVVRVADNPWLQSAEESMVEARAEDGSHSFDVGSKAQDGGSLGVGQLTRGPDFPPMSGSGASTSEKNGRNNNRSSVGSPARDLTVQLFGDQPIGLIQAAQGPCIIPNTAENDMEGETFLESVDSRSARSQCMPVLLSEKVIDLYVMDEQVQSHGGYELVTTEGLWGNISEALGLGADCGPGLKLIYFKYLRHLERKRDRGLLLERRHQDSELNETVNMAGSGLPNENGLLNNDKGENNYSPADSEQFAESEPFHEKLGEEQTVNGRDDALDIDHSEDEAEIRSGERETKSAKSPSPSQYRSGSFPLIGSCSFSQECQDLPEALLSDHHRLLKGYIDHHHGTGGPAIMQKRELATDTQEHGVVYDVGTIERFKKSLADTLMWIKRIAVDPGNPQMGQGAEGTGQNEKWVAECSSQAQKVRALFWRRRDDVRWGEGHSHQAKQQIAPPSIYYEDAARQEQVAPERPRATRERAAHHHGSTSAQKPFNESVNFQTSSSPPSNQQPQWAGQTSQRLSRQSHHIHNEERYPDEILDRPRRRVPIGEDSQAHIPSFRPADHRHSSVGAGGIAGPSGDETQSSDGNDEEDHSRWLGKQVWPPPGCKRFAFKDLSAGRRPVCSCSDPGSRTCVRRHIEEERDRLKAELGQAFYIWKFDQMGESVGDKWSKDEQQTYQELVKMNPPSRGKSFWDQLPEAFPGKTMQELVSFYFNVFVLKRRATQNRLDSHHVDSDDDETLYPDCESEDSDDYESGDDADEEEYQDASDDEDDTDKEDDGPCGSDSSGKLLEDPGFCDMGGYSSKLGSISPLDEAQGVPMTLRTARLMNLEDVEQEGYHDPHQEEIDVRLRTAHMTAKWNHQQQHDDDDEKRIEDGHVSIAGEEELREVKTWEASHWDEADHDGFGGHEQVAKGMISSKREQTPEREPSPLYKKVVVDGTSQHHPSLVGSCEVEVWTPNLDIAPINQRDKLLSTKGMIQEFFGNDTSGLNASG